MINRCVLCMQRDDEAAQYQPKRCQVAKIWIPYLSAWLACGCPKLDELVLDGVNCPRSDDRYVVSCDCNFLVIRVTDTQCSVRLQAPLYTTSTEPEVELRSTWFDVLCRRRSRRLSTVQCYPEVTHWSYTVDDYRSVIVGEIDIDLSRVLRLLHTASRKKRNACHRSISVSATWPIIRSYWIDKCDLCLCRLLHWWRLGLLQAKVMTIDAWNQTL